MPSLLAPEAAMAKAQENVWGDVTAANHTVEIERSVLVAALGTLEHVLAQRFLGEEQPTGLLRLLPAKDRRLGDRIRLEHRIILKKLGRLRSRAARSQPLEAAFDDFVQLVSRHESSMAALRHATLGREY
jgi:hypothetical protein